MKYNFGNMSYSRSCFLPSRSDKNAKKNTLVLKMAEGPTAFSTDVSDKFVGGIKASVPDEISQDELDWKYDIPATADWIKAGSYGRVALQFADSLLVHSVLISRRLEALTGSKIYILADTSYGSCCVDEVAAQHCAAECLVHYGDSCLSPPPETLPVRYVFAKERLDFEKLGNELKGLKEPPCNLLLVYDLSLEHDKERIIGTLKANYSGKLFVAHPQVPDATSVHEDSGRILGRRIASVDGSETDMPESDFAILFIGDSEKSPLLTLWLLTQPSSQHCFCFNPETGGWTDRSSSTSRLMRKRLFLMEKLKDAQIVGLIAGTLGVQGHRAALDRVKQLCRASGKRVYTFSVGKLSPAKLANFATDIDLFVLVSCPFGVLLEFSDYFRPVLSPFEVEMALNPGVKPWFADSAWHSEFHRLRLTSTTQEKAEGDDEMEVAEPDFSLVTGKLRLPKNTDGSNQAVVEYNPGDYFQGRSWKGLEQDIGEELPIEEATEGRKGIAAGYSNEMTEK